MQLLLTLGHHSSAILVDNNEVVCGYEEERLSKVKSTSAYPILSIEKILSYCNYARHEVREIYISHWFNLGPDNLNESKYFQPKHLKTRFPHAEIHSLHPKFTHHDAHAGSVWNFSGYATGLTIVSDGFGNDGETVSIYRDGERIARHYGLSLGLMYQYTTSYLGMKENQDEYKLLGYESNVTEEVAKKLEAVTTHYVNLIYSTIVQSDMSNSMTYQVLCSQNKTFYVSMLDRISNELGAQDDKLSSIAFAVQRILESVMIAIINDYIEHRDILQFAGGVFYNVKLNNVILNKFADNVEVIEFMPLAGDQGAAIGFLPRLNIDHFMWGLRDTQGFVYDIGSRHNIEFHIGSAMEFGPRALGNTSCIADPTPEAVEHINELNGRPNIMPMAPMIHSTIAYKYCKNIEKLGKCKQFMICATDWIGPIDQFRGVLHKKPLQDVYTCRAQVVDNVITQKRGIVINTSLNAHGQPIIYDMSDYSIMVNIHEKNKTVHANSKNVKNSFERLH